jgi:hypothetical protein
VIKRVLSFSLLSIAALVTGACSKDAKSGGDDKIGGQIQPRIKEGQNVPNVPQPVGVTGVPADPKNPKAPTKPTVNPQ